MDAGDFDPASMPTSTRQIPVIAAFSIMFAAASVAVGLRFYTRMKFLGGFKTEDWFILAAWVRSYFFIYIFLPFHTPAVRCFGLGATANGYKPSPQKRSSR